MTVCFSASFIPQIWKTYKTKSSKDISYGLLLLSYSGHILALIHAFCNNSHNIWLVTGYILGIIFLTCLIALKWCFDRKSKQNDF